MFALSFHWHCNFDSACLFDQISDFVIGSCIRDIPSFLAQSLTYNSSGSYFICLPNSYFYSLQYCKFSPAPLCDCFWPDGRYLSVWLSFFAPCFPGPSMLSSNIVSVHFMVSLVAFCFSCFFSFAAHGVKVSVL